MKNKSPKEFSAFHLFAGLLVGFFLGTSVVYWHNNRQNDRLIAEALDRVIKLFSDHGVHIEQPDSILIVQNNQENTHTPPNRNIRSSLPSASPLSNLIAQDRLLFSKTIAIRKTRDNVSTSARKLDSLIGNINPGSNEDIYVVEFWESPLNSTGYKMGKNKIVLYGIRSFDMVTLTKHNKKVYMKYFNELYPLEITTSFKPLIPVAEPLFFPDYQSF
ncbi:MAG: hypothetical protein EA361_06890 [Bacteroidetes bacterium]|nr:MAG: hypothetical protein EA361_06890 [Bacteroidota bacterium]